MSHPVADLESRSPRPWWFRLIVWIVVLAIIVAAIALTIQSGSYGATTHTTSRAQKSATGEPASSVAQLASYGPGVELAGSVAAQLDKHGVIARDAVTGVERWRYTRSDTAVCAQQTTAHWVVLMYQNGDRCAEAIALDSTSGARLWQRTLEAAGPNRIVFTESGFISVDAVKMISYDSTQGYERFTLDNTRAEPAEGPRATCENLDAAGQTMVATLQRCRTADDAPWAMQVVINTPSDGKPREAGRSYLSGIESPELIGVAVDGTSFIRGAGGIVSVFPVGAQQASAVKGLPALGTATHLLAERGSVVISDASTAYGLDTAKTAVSWSEPITAAPSQFGVTIYIPTPQGIQFRKTDAGTVLRTIELPMPAGAKSVVVSGPLVGVRDDSGLSIYR